MFYLWSDQKFLTKSCFFFISIMCFQILYIHHVFPDPGRCYSSFSFLARWIFRGQTASVVIKKRRLTLWKFHLPCTWKLRKEVRTFHWFNFSVCWWNRYTQGPFLISRGNTAHSSVFGKCRVQLWAQITPYHGLQLKFSFNFPSVFG